MNDEQEWTLHKHGVRITFVVRGEMIFIKRVSKENTSWDLPMPKSKARNMWDKLVRDNFTLFA